MKGGKHHGWKQCCGVLGAPWRYTILCFLITNYDGITLCNVFISQKDQNDRNAIVHRHSPQNQIIKGSDRLHNPHSIQGESVTSRCHGSKISGSQQYGATSNTLEDYAWSSLQRKVRNCSQSVRKEHFVCLHFVDIHDHVIPLFLEVNILPLTFFYWLRVCVNFKVAQPDFSGSISPKFER